jgi:CHASE2 domain
MRRPSLWLMLVVLLLGLLFLREPRLQRSEEIFLRWLLKNSQPRDAAPPLTIVEIGREPIPHKESAEIDPTERFLRGGASANSPLEAALLLQAALEFKPAVIAFEPVLKWPEREKDQEQIFVDQAMRAPKLLLGAELTATPDPDAPVAEIPAFPQVTGKRGDLIEFSGIGRQPDEDVSLIGTLGFLNLPNETAAGVHVPLLFQYRGEVIPSFALQAALLWLRVTPAEVKIDIGKYIWLPHSKIPIRSDGTAVINPNAAQRARRLSLNELLLAAQERQQGKASVHLDEMRDQIVLARTPANSLASPDVFAATIATIQTNSFVRRVSWIFDCVMILVVTGASFPLRKFSRIDLILGAIAFSAGYCLVALGILSRWSIWLPGFLPLGAVWTVVLLSLILPAPKNASRAVAVAASPPVP